MNQVVGSVLPAAVAVALSPIPIVAVIVMLGTARARSNGPAFAVGWVGGLSIVLTVVVLLVGGASPKTADTSVRWGTLALGLLMLGLAGRQWRKRPRHGDEPEVPAWVDRVDDFTWHRSLVTGVILSAANPKNLALTAAASGAIATSGLQGPDELWASVWFVAIASSTVVGLVVVALVAPRATSRPLSTIREYMATHSSVIMAVILLLLGVKLVGDAIGR